jgi:hypothetical protein
MNFKKAVILTGFAILMMVTAQIVLAEEVAGAPADSGVVVSTQQPNLQNDMQWAWGEVTNLDNQAKTITLKYLDYETDQEKDLVLGVDEKTTFENIKDFSELKIKDTLSVDYAIGADNKNLAKNISFEKPEAVPSTSTSMPVVENSQPATMSSGAEQPAAEAAQPAALPGAAVDLAQPAAQSGMPADSSAPANQTPSPASAVSETTPAVSNQAQ